MDLTGNVPLIVGIILLLLLWVLLMRKRNPEKERRTIVQSLLSEVRLNQAVLELCRVGEEPKKFSVTNWRINKDRLAFLTQSLQVDLYGGYDIAEDFNHQIDVAKKHSVTGYAGYIDTDRLTEPLAKCREGLEDWLKANGGLSSGPSIEYPSMFDTLFGGRR